MSDDLRALADARLEQALAGSGLRDPRPLFRPALKHLRERDTAGFQRALAHYESHLVPAVAGGGDALAEWLAYGRLLAECLGPGRRVEVDPTGRAATPADPAAASGLVLHLPDDAAAPALALHCPRDLSRPQEATLELLVAGRLSASAYD
jgi:hypothetical protein